MTANLKRTMRPTRLRIFCSLFFIVAVVALLGPISCSRAIGQRSGESLLKMVMGTESISSAPVARHRVRCRVRVVGIQAQQAKTSIG